MFYKFLCVLFIIALSISFAHNIRASVTDLSPAEFSAQFQNDVHLLKTYVHNMDQTMGIIDNEQTLFNKERKKDFNIVEREKLYSLWGSYLDYTIAIEGLTEYYKKFYLLPNRERLNKAFLLAYASYITKISNGLRFVSKTINNELYEKKLDDRSSEYGIPQGMYAKLKWNTIHVQDVSNILSGYAYYKFLQKYYKKHGLMDDETTGWIFGHIQSAYEYINNELKLKGVEYFTANGLDILRDSSFKAWFPVQRNVAQMMGNIKVKRLHRYLIEDDQIVQMGTFLKPGDIIVTRRNWYLSNIGLPGFWPHAALYIGSYSEMKEFFNDAPVIKYVRSMGNYKDFMDYLENKYPQEMSEFLKKAPDENPYRVIEAVSEGVTFSSLQEATSADYTGVMRPRLSRLDIAKAIDEAFHYLGRPYDFNFDFLTDSTIVCSELIYKVYMRGQHKNGLHMKLTEIAGRKVVPPNNIVRKFDREFGTPDQELDFVYFLDGSEKNKKAVVKDLTKFRKSHKRPKWDIAQK